ncbi:hypothetical protein GCM10009430_44790 [Aquimarina litoralis]|uniref:DUF1963 domain-containing protein n=1 Tax=Aquimarina litoralis TaxID=584605 RepID=A0ABP3UGW5_9FLAO
MKEYFKINNIDVGFANHPTVGTIFTKGALNTEIFVRKGKLRISLLTPSLTITDQMHNGMLSDPYFDNLRHIDYLRMVTYYDLEVESGAYNTQIVCPYGNNATGFETYGFPEPIRFHGTIDIQEGYVAIKGEFRNSYGDEKPSIPVEVIKSFEPKKLLPKRGKYTLDQAREKDPEEVYALHIGKGTFKEFPEEVLGYKNLESLWVGGQAQFDFKILPDAFFELKELHTIQFYNNTIGEVSEKIEQLSKLEELIIRSGNLVTLPDNICELEQLSNINFEYNQLTSLPENIGLLPNLKELNIVGNRFKELPKSLNNIFSVKIDRKHRKLYQDTNYKSKNPNGIDEALYDLSRYPNEKQYLEKIILDIPELVSFKDLILEYSSIATYLIPDIARKEITIGASKVGGTPDLPKEWEHPTNKNGNFYIFHAQINCEEAASFQSYLPRKGMLYFFVNDEEYAQHPIVLYAESDQELVSTSYDQDTKFTDSDFDGNPRNAVALKFQNAISIPNVYNSMNHGEERFPKYAFLFQDDSDEAYDRMELLEEYIEQLEDKINTPLAFDNGHIQLASHSIHSSVFTQHESPQEIAAAKFGGEPSEWMVLLNMESVGEFSFWDAGTLTYCIHKKDLAIQNFSNISSSIESS